MEKCVHIIIPGTEPRYLELDNWDNSKRRYYFRDELAKCDLGISRKCLFEADQELCPNNPSNILSKLRAFFDTRDAIKQLAEMGMRPPPAKPRRSK